MTLSKPPFTKQDESNFVQFVSEHLTKGASSIRGISENEYVNLARRQWSMCATDKVYAIKLLIDPLVQPELTSDMPELLVSSGQPFCLLIARIDENGALTDAPEGYTPPAHPGIALGHIPAGSPTGGEVPDVREPQNYLVAFLDVLGFKQMLINLGLEEVLRKYQQLLEVALSPYSESQPWSKALTVVGDKVVPGLMWLPIQTTYFSDSLLLWVHYHPGHVAEFLSRCSYVFCQSLALGIPLRGAISAGQAVMDKATGIYIGQPLVEAALLEDKSDWVGVTLGESWKSSNMSIPVPPDKVHIYNPPLKEGGQELNSGLVLDWPRIWRDSREDDAVDYLNRLKDSIKTHMIKSKYDAALEFFSFSKQNSNWDIPQGGLRITPSSITMRSS